MLTLIIELHDQKTRRAVRTMSHLLSKCSELAYLASAKLHFFMMFIFRVRDLYSMKSIFLESILGIKHLDLLSPSKISIKNSQRDKTLSRLISKLSDILIGMTYDSLRFVWMIYIVT